MVWNILDTRSVWMREFAAALADQEVVRCWHPEYQNVALGRTQDIVRRHADPGLIEHHFPLQRGYGHPFAGRLLPWERAVTRMLEDRSPSPVNDVLICTAPYYAPIAERWLGKVVYYSTDLTKLYDGANAAHVINLDRRMCRVATAVCPNSERIAHYLKSEALCSPEKITVIPNATRAQNVAERPLVQPEPLVADIADLPRPVIGVIGNLADNIDWTLLNDGVRRVPNVSWVFVGPTNSPMQNRVQADLRAELLKVESRVRFLGSRPYGQLQSYARCFDAALIPYQNVEPTISGSATRFYEHLAACRPILATRAHGELLKKEPLLTLVSSGEELQATIETLRAQGFQDGLETLRWQVSRSETWANRATSLVNATAEGVARQRNVNVETTKPMVAHF